MKIKTKNCKQCKEPFVVNPIFPLQFICTPKCAIERASQQRKVKQEKEWKEKKSVMKITTHSKEYRKSFQDEVNKLSRMIDESFGYNSCIDCDKSLFGYQIDACHLISRKKNSSLKWNLHNLHSGHNHCNFYNERHESNYKTGIKQRYGNHYLDMVENLPIQYKSIIVSNLEVFEKLKLVRGLIRHFNTYKLESSIQARNLFNNLIGIYTK